MEGGKNVSNKRRRYQSLDVSDPGNGLDVKDNPQKEARLRHQKGSPSMGA